MCKRCTFNTVIFYSAVWAIAQSVYHTAIITELLKNSLSQCSVRHTNASALLMHFLSIHNQDCGANRSINYYMNSDFAKTIIPKDAKIIGPKAYYSDIHNFLVDMNKLGPKSNHVHSNYLTVIMIIWIILDSLWILTSLILFCGVFCAHHMQLVSALLLMVPWVIVTFANIIFDHYNLIIFLLRLHMLKTRGYIKLLHSSGYKNRNLHKFKNYDLYLSPKYKSDIHQKYFLFVLLASRIPVLSSVLNICLCALIFTIIKRFVQMHKRRNIRKSAATFFVAKV